MIKGVQSVEPGYAGPAYTNEQGRTLLKKSGPSYEEVSSGATPYVESAKVVYDPDQIAFPELLQVYFDSHDPTQQDGQGSDIGPQYRPAVFYTTVRQMEMTEHYIKNLSLKYGDTPVATSVEPLVEFYKAEDYHQKYYENNKGAGYCQLIITPKVEKVQAKFKNLLK